MDSKLIQIRNEYRPQSCKEWVQNSEAASMVIVASICLGILIGYGLQLGLSCVHIQPELQILFYK